MSRIYVRKLVLQKRVFTQKMNKVLYKCGIINANRTNIARYTKAMKLGTNIH